MNFLCHQNHLQIYLLHYLVLLNDKECKIGDTVVTTRSY